MSPNTMWNESSFSTGFHNVPLHTAHFFEGVNLMGVIPLLEWVDLPGLGVSGIVTAGPLLMEGWMALMELTGMFTCCGSVALVVDGGGTRLSIGKAGSSGAGSIELKGWWESGELIPVLFQYLPSASSLK